VGITSKVGRNVSPAQMAGRRATITFAHHDMNMDRPVPGRGRRNVFQERGDLDLLFDRDVELLPIPVEIPELDITECTYVGDLSRRTILDARPAVRPGLG
jgi:hypothetical protein